MLNARSFLTTSSVVMVSLFLTMADGAAQAPGRDHTGQGFHATPSAGVSASLFSPDRLSLVLRDGESSARAARQRSRDSLKNGIVIGALAGAAALGTFGAVLCNALQEPGGPSCLGDTLRIAALGAAIGAGAGLAIDAAFTRQAGVRVSLRVRF